MSSEIEHYDYELPRERIAQRPLACRTDARLLVVRRQESRWEHSHVRNLEEWLRPGDLLVLNDTRVIPARLSGRRTNTGGRWSGLFIGTDEAGNWQVLSKTRGRLAPGETITLQDRQRLDRYRLMLLADLGEGRWAVRPDSSEAALQILEQVGRVPLPPYIRDGEMVESDRQDYQTVYAEKAGAVAAPTAGLHFTESLLERLAAAGIGTCTLTLHVGLGTFRPVSAEKLSDHTMHAEWACLESAAAARMRAVQAAGGRLVAVGTTVVRTLETIAANGPLRAWQGETQLFIRPPFEFRAVDALMTNFHLPKSTLLVLVRTFGGDALIRRAYEEAIRERYRFYSYGDAMLIL